MLQGKKNTWKLAVEAEIVAIFQTNTKLKKINITQRECKQSTTIPIHDGLRGFGVSSVKSSPIVNYCMISKTAQSTYQSVTILTCDVKIAAAYVFPKTTAEEELELVQHAKSHNNWNAILVGDMNLKQLDCGTERITRGRWLENVQQRGDGT